jgi:hypothetical protein
MFWPFGLFLLTVPANYILMHSNWLVTLAAGGGSKVVIVRFFVLFVEAIHTFTTVTQIKSL